MPAITRKNPSTRKNPITINEDFCCKKCGKYNQKAPKTCRNHCRFCLFSMHVDKHIPGDRSSHCAALMEPISIDRSGKKGYRIMHQCLKCRKKMVNKAAEDDSLDSMIEVMRSGLPQNDK